MTETFSLSKEELKRLEVVSRIEAGLLTAKEAADLLELSVRQVRRVLAVYRGGGPSALAHGNRGRKPAHTIKSDVRDRVIELVRTKYTDYNHQHLSEVLEGEEVKLSRSTVRRILVGVGLVSPRKRRRAKHRQRRERYVQEGMLVQVDGSDHDWLEGRGAWLCLVAGVDDATGKIVGATFRRQEDAQGYFVVLQQVLGRYGVPLALYHDLHGIFVRSNREVETLQEQLRGKREPTQFGRALEELGIASIDAHSPQAKGRIERLFGTLQDRLVKALREAGAKTVEESNVVLTEFIEGYNAQFAVAAEHPGLAYRAVLLDFESNTVLCFKYERVVGADNTVRFAGERLQILPNKGRASYAKLHVEVHERLDGSLVVYHEGRCLATREAPKEPRELRARRSTRPISHPQTATPESSVLKNLPSRSVEGLQDPASGIDATKIQLPDQQSANESEGGRIVPSYVDKRTGERIYQPSRPSANHPWRAKWNPSTQQLSKQG